MSKCYRCDMCGVVTILRDPINFIDLDVPDYDEPAMVIYAKKKNYDICPNCAPRIINAIERKNAADEFLKN